MSSSRRALKFALASQYTAQIVAFVSVIVVARLLSPEEIGIYSVAAVVLFLASEVRNFGVAQYIVREPEMDAEKLSRATAVVSITSWAMAALLIVFARRFANFYGEPGLQEVLQLVAGGFLLTPLISVPYAYMVRNMQFDKILRVQVTGSVTQLVVTVGLAYLGFSYMSLAWGLTLSVVSNAIVVTIYRDQEVPFLPSFKALRDVLSFGTFAGAGSVIAKVSEGIPDLVLGRVASMTDVGIFSRAVGVVILFDRAVTLAVRPVVLPHLSDAFRTGHSVAYAYLRAVELHTGLAWSFFAVFSASYTR